MGVPRGTTGLSVEYPPEPPPPLLQSLLDALLGPVSLMLAAGAAFTWFWFLARANPGLADVYLYTAIGFTVAMYALDILITFRSEGGIEVFWMLASDWAYMSEILESRTRTLTVVGALASMAGAFL